MAPNLFSHSFVYLNLILESTLTDMMLGRRNKFLSTAGWQNMRMFMILSVYQLILS